MDVNNGEVLALGSQPSFDPNIFTKPITQKRLDALSSDELGKPLFNRAIQGGYPTGSTFKLDHRHGGARERAHHPGHGPERPGLAHGRRRDVRERRQGRPRRARAAPGAHGLERRLLLPARPVHEREGHAAPEVGAPARDRAQDRHRPPGGGARAAADAEVARPLVQAGPHRPALVRRRQHQPLRRPGRPALQPAPDGRGLRRDRQRRARAAAAPGPAHRGRVGPGAPAARRADRPAAEDLEGEPRRDPRGPPRRRERPGRNLDAGLRGIPDTDCRKDRNRRARGQGGPVMVRRPGSVPEPQVRRGGDRRGRWLRR